MLKAISVFFSLMVFSVLHAQTPASIAMHSKKDSVLRAAYHADSLKIEKQFAETQKWDDIKSMVIFPVIKAGDFSGVIPVKNITEIPDPAIEYKLLFELISNNPDSMAMDINFGLTEVARIINLHVASGIPIQKIKPVIVVHAAALNAITNNAGYQKRYKINNPNLEAITALEKLGTKIIACGQAMTFFDIRPEELLKEVKVSLTAQTVISSYQLKGYVWFDMNMDNK